MAKCIITLCRVTSRANKRGFKDGGSIPKRGNDGIFSIRYRVQNDSGAPPILLSDRYEGSYPDGKAVRE
jgi:hypothetical protein